MSHSYGGRVGDTIWRRRETTLEEYKIALAQARADNEKLREENNNFRLLLLTTPLEVDQVYLAQQRNHWGLRPVEELMTFLELYEAHKNVFAELVHAKMSKTQVKEFLNKKVNAKEKAAKDFRVNNNIGMTEQEKQESYVVRAENAAKDKAIKSLAKSLKITYAVAGKMLGQMTMDPMKLKTENKNV
jgi:hypothetical protein